MRCLILLSLIISIGPIWLSAQLNIPPNQSKNPNQQKKSTFNRVFEGQPGKAALYSLILPGAGQIYNKRYWKAPLVWAGEGYIIYNLATKISSYNKLNNCHISLTNADGNASLYCGTVSSVTTAFSNAQSARSDKELAWVFMGAVHLINVLDAFIDRHLINFDTSDDLSFNFSPTDHYNFSPTGSAQLTLFQVNINISH